jgi:hypothetical protein
VHEHLKDYEVLDDERSVGRIYEIRAPLQPNQQWFWSITLVGAHASGIITSGRAATFEAAKVQFSENWTALVNSGGHVRK